MISSPLNVTPKPASNPAARRRLKELRRRALSGDAEPNGELSDLTPTQGFGKVGLLVTCELEKARRECAALVDEIVEDCQRKNRKFRDLEFDIEHDFKRCLNGSLGNLHHCVRPEPRGIQRVSDLFANPSFFKDGAHSRNIRQGCLGDCWFLSALSTLASGKDLIEGLCIKQNAKVGVYGFIFFRDNHWVPVIIDDMLFTALPKWDELTQQEKMAYGYNKAAFKLSLNTGDNLAFAKPGEGEQTWVPLVEKAFAKLYGSFRALNHGGDTGEAIETLTGGVNTFYFTKDILDKGKFWTEELMKANTDRLFGCSFTRSTTSDDPIVMVDGLEANHTYSILRARELGGKRFLVIRNPWGSGEWTGPWSDGSKEWTDRERGELLKGLGHEFGDDGQFVMEYQTFLEVWDQVDRTRLFDKSWAMSSDWLTVTMQPKLSAWTFGEVSFTFEVTADTPAIIVLAQADRRFFHEVLDPEHHTFDFVVYRRGETKALAFSSHSNLNARSVNAELELKAGSYVVHLRIDRHCSFDRHLSRLNTEWTRSCSLASDFDKKKHSRFLPVELSKLAGKDLEELKTIAQSRQFFDQKDIRQLSASPTTTVFPEFHKTAVHPHFVDQHPPERPKSPLRNGVYTRPSMNSITGPSRNGTGQSQPERQETVMSGAGGGKIGGRPSVIQNHHHFHFHHPVDPTELPLATVTESCQQVTSKSVKEAGYHSDDDDDENRFVGQLTLGLRVYTKNEHVAKIQGHIRRNMGFSYVDI